MALIFDHSQTPLSLRDTAWSEDRRDNPRFLTRWVSHRDAAETLRSAWDDLAANASEPNPFYEPHLLLPALDNLAAKSDIRLIAVEDRMQPGRLIALMPVQIRSTYRGLPIRTAHAWRSVHTFLATPLVRKGCEWDAMRALVAGLRQDGVRLIRLPHMASDGPIADALSIVAKSHGLATAVSRRFARALLQSKQSGDAYIEGSVSKKKRKEYARQSRRLSELGGVTFEEPDTDDPAAVEGIVLQFLELERQSWKGRAGTALAQRPAEARFFLQACRAAAAAGKLHCLTLNLDGVPIASIVNFAGGSDESTGMFSFKIAYDEAYARYSPGVLLELELTRLMLSRDGVVFTDSCANPDHPMIDHLWRERRAMQDGLFATTRLLPSILVSAVNGLDKAELKARALARSLLTRIKRSVA